MLLEQLEQKARNIRLEALDYTVKKKRGHLGGTFSCVDILVSLYYGDLLKIDPHNPSWPDRDRFILSKGHACLGLYSILVDLGFISRNKLESYGENGGLGGQLDISIPGVDWNTGSLGHALGVCAGIALGSKLSNKRYYAITLLGDAECSEGSIWEALIFAGQHKLNNLIGIIDRNRMSVTDVLDDNSFYAKFSLIIPSLGWKYVEINGHSFPDIINAITSAKQSDIPTLIVANTIKGKGVSFMENDPQWHHAVPGEAQLKLARQELA